MKPTVTYKPLGEIVVGEGASVIPLNHPGNENDCSPFHMIENGYPSYTSKVLKHDKKTGQFETLNTIYVRSAQ